MEASELIKTLSELVSSGNPMIAVPISVALIIITFALVITTVIDVLKKFKDVASGTLIKIIPKDFIGSKLPKVDDVKKRIKIDKVINDVLDDVVKQYDVDRVMLCQFHNGTSAKSGMPFEYGILTHEALSYGTPPSTIGRKHYDIRLFTQVLESMILTGQSFKAETKDMSQPLLGFLNENNSKRFISKVLTDAINSDYIIGVVIFSKISDTPFKDGIEEQMSHVCDVCSGILSTAWGSCEQCARRGVKGKYGCPKQNHTSGRCELYQAFKSTPDEPANK